jgi:F-type H+-transporting ATPase subunit delta
VKGRIGEIPGIFNSLQSLTDTRAGVVRAQVTSAAKLAPNQVNAIKAALAKKTGKKVLVETEVDEALIGGVITRLGGKVYDGSIRTQLQAIRTAAAERV